MSKERSLETLQFGVTKTSSAGVHWLVEALEFEFEANKASDIAGRLEGNV